jgi:probable O-glycosylation ligase (exosortase A-associated)
MRDLFLIVIVIACSVVALRKPVFGLLAFVSLGILNPHSLAWGIGRTFRHSLFVGASTIVGYLFWTEPKRLPIKRESVLLVALLFICGFSTLFAIYPDRAFDKLISVSKILLIVLLSTSIINTERRLHLLLRVIAFSLGFYAVKGGIFSVATAGNYMVFGPDGSFFSGNNGIGMALVMNVPLLFYLSKMESKRWIRLVTKAMLYLSYPAVIFTYSRGAWLGLLLVTALLAVKSRHKILLGVGAGIWGVILFSFFIQVVPEKLTDRYESLVNYKQDESAQSRFWNWEFCQRVGRANPWTGGGFDFQSPETYARYYPEFLERWPGKVWSCHSMWFTMLGEHGFPGLFVWVALVASCFRSVRAISLFAGTRPEMSWTVNYADMVRTAIFAFMVLGTFVDIAYFDIFYYLVGMLIIVKDMIARERAELVSRSRVTAQTVHFEPG